MEKKMNKFFKILLISSVTFSLFSGPNEDLLIAVQLVDLIGVEAAIAAGADIDAADINGNTALIFAASYGHRDVVRLLLDRGAGINAVDVLRDTALIKAAFSGHRDVIRLLLDRGAGINGTALILAAQNDHIDTVKLLLSRGANINAINDYGSTSLIQAAQNDHTDIVKLLLSRGANINAVDVIGNTALIQTAFNGHRDTVRLLLKMGANINATNNYGATALRFARLQGHTEIVKIFEEMLEIKQLVDNAIQGDSLSRQKLIEKIKDLNIDSYEFNLILNYLINKIKDVGVNRNSRKLLIDLAYHIAINLGSAVVGLLPEDILMPMLRGFLPYADLEYEFDMMHLDADNQPIKRNLLEIIYAFYKKIEKLEERKAELEVDHALEYE